MERIALYAIILIVALVVGAFAWVQYSEFSFLPKEAGKTWVIIDSTQGIDPWEQRPVNDTQFKNAVADFYLKQNITIFSVKTRNTHEGEAICLALSCYGGYTLYLLVLDSDVGKMLSYGYKVA